MKRSFVRSPSVALALLAAGALAAAPVLAQGELHIPSSGNNQKASVSQWIGPVEVNVTYNSPDVTAPDGTDRTGAIWGQLVPYGMARLSFGPCGDQCPWRAGANENTVFTVSHDVLVEGEPLAAGTYGLHMIPREDTWTVIFSNDSASWGSYYYDPANDALRVEVTPEEHAFSEWLDYEFVDRQPGQATVALQWENLQVPWTVQVPNVNELHLAEMTDDLKGSAGFTWTNWVTAANVALQLGDAEQGVEWARQAVGFPGIGQANFTTLSTLALAQAAAGDGGGLRESLGQAAAHPTANPIQVHGLARTLLAQGRTDDAVWLFDRNAELYPGEWPVEVGLARARSAQGDFDQALVHVRKAIAQAPDDQNRQSLEGLVPRLEAGEDIN